MREILVILIFSFSLFGCNNIDTNKTTNNEQVTKQYIDTTQNNSKRQILIAELKKLQQIIASNDKEKIAGIFPFPLSDTAFSIFIDDSSYNEQFAANGNKTTQVMFLQHFKEISESVWVDQVNILFKNISVDSLLFKDRLEFDDYIKTEPCFYSYKIEVVESVVTLRMDMQSNRQYKSTTNLKNQTPENSSEICEHNFWWVFKFDGKKLRLTDISGAG